MTERLTELEYLREFYQRADFGPADSDVREIINEDIEKDTGKAIPENYESDY